jgi:hypothetical protein
MKNIIRFGVVAWMALMMHTQTSIAQKIDEDRMKRDIEVAENVLSTLIKQEINQQRGFFGFEIKGTYLPGYGVTFRLPGDHAGSFLLPMEASTVIWNSDRAQGGTIAVTTNGDEEEDNDGDGDDIVGARAYKLKDREKEKRRVNFDSVRTAYNAKVIKASKDFILDYGDFISQLGPNEKIVITNQGGDNRVWIYNKNQKRTHLSIEASKADVLAFKQGKISRDQAMQKLKVINTESMEVTEPDMELLSSIFTRLYRTDLSKTYFTEENIYYERLKDYGVIYYMHVYSGYNADYKRFNMPTVDMQDVDQETRDKKVIELYPKFEQDVKENMLEYGRTLKSLKDEELLVFNIALTKCKGCNIPSTLELSVKNSVLKDYGAGKIDKSSALSKFSVKKGPNQ